jgi:CO dehydrogenase maturation factor
MSDVAREKYAYIKDGVSLLVLGAVEGGGAGCACPENVLLRALVQDLILHKNEALVMDMEAGVEHLGRATAKGVDTMVVVVEPGQRSIDCAKRVYRMAQEIGLKDIRVVANKVSGAEDEKFIRDSLDGCEILGMIPFSEELLAADRDGRSVLDHMQKPLLGQFEKILQALETEVGK